MPGRALAKATEAQEQSTWEKAQGRAAAFESDVKGLRPDVNGKYHATEVHVVGEHVAVAPLAPETKTASGITLPGAADRPHDVGVCLGASLDCPITVRQAVGSLVKFSPRSVAELHDTDGNPVLIVSHKNIFVNLGRKNVVFAAINDNIEPLGGVDPIETELKVRPN